MPDNPLRQIDSPFVGSIALVRRLVADDEQWLAVWDEQAGVMQLPTARRDEGETYRSCLNATLESQLGLDHRRDFVIAGLSRSHFQAPIEWPGEQQPQWVSSSSSPSTCTAASLGRSSKPCPAAAG